MGISRLLFSLEHPLFPILFVLPLPPSAALMASLFHLYLLLPLGYLIFPEIFPPTQSYPLFIPHYIAFLDLQNIAPCWNPFFNTDSLIKY